MIELVKYAEKHGASEKQIETLRQYEMMCSYEYRKFRGDDCVNFAFLTEKLVDLIRGRNALKTLFGFRPERNRGYAWDAVDAEYQAVAQQWTSALKEQQHELSETCWAFGGNNSYMAPKGFQWFEGGNHYYCPMKEICERIAEHVVFGWIDEYASDARVLAAEKREALK